MSAQNPSWKGQTALLPENGAEVFFDGTLSRPQLNHPESVAFDAEGNLWCGGEKGEIYRLSNGEKLEQIATTDGFTLGIAFDGKGRLYSCDLRHGKVFRLDENRNLSVFAEGNGKGDKIKIPNFPVVDNENGWLYVTDSHNPSEPGPGIWRFDLETGEGDLWYRGSMTFANGAVMEKGGGALYVAETFANRVSRIPILADGSAGEKETVTEVPAYPDGLAVDKHGRLYISCYEPSLVYRWTKDRGLELLYYDPTAHTLCHPTNCAFHNGDLYTANLGRWHITRIIGVENLD